MTPSISTRPPLQHSQWKHAGQERALMHEHRELVAQQSLERFKRKAKQFFRIRKTSTASSSSPHLLASPPQRSARPRSLNLLRKRPRMTTTQLQLLSVRQAATSKDNADELHFRFALRIATIVLAVLLSLVFIAAAVFLPISILALQGIPLLLAMVIAIVLFLQSVERLESGRVIECCQTLSCSGLTARDLGT